MARAGFGWPVESSGSKGLLLTLPGAGKLTLVFFLGGPAFFWKALAVSEPAAAAATHSGPVTMPGIVGTAALLFEGSVQQWLLFP